MSSRIWGNLNASKWFIVSAIVPIIIVAVIFAIPFKTVPVEETETYWATEMVQEEYTVTEPYWVKKSNDIMVYLFAYSWIGNINGKPAHGIGKDTSVIIKENCVWLLLAENSGSDSLINLSTKAIFP